MNILSLTYLGNIQWFGKLCLSDCAIDVGEHYLKQSYRNRCEIMSSGGRTMLVVNTQKGNNLSKTTVRDTRIDYSKRWQHQHRQTIVSAYSAAPFFEHYWPDLEPFYLKRYDFLYDFNARLLETVLRLLGVDAKTHYLYDYVEPNGGFADLRDAISPKPRLSKPDPLFRPAPYWQVFSDRLPFEPNLSIIDLLFCEGTDALRILRESTFPQP